MIYGLKMNVEMCAIVGRQETNPNLLRWRMANDDQSERKAYIGIRINSGFESSRRTVSGYEMLSVEWSSSINDKG